MRTVHVETGRHFYGGAQQVIWLLEGLCAAGIDCQLVCPPDSDIESAAHSAKLPVIAMRCSGDHDLRFGWNLRRYLKREAPDLVHCHSRRGADFLGGWAARLAGVPAVLSRRVDNPEGSTLAAARYRPYSRIIAISNNIATLLTDNGLDPARLQLIRDAVDVARINQSPDVDVLERLFDIKSQHFSIAIVAQLIRRKGHRFLLDVLPGLLAKHPQIKVVLFGIGPEEEQLRALSRKLGLSGAVTFAGFRLDLDDYLGAFDLLVHPAEQEGLGVALLKGAAAGLPVIAFDIAGAKEAVEHGVTGALIPSGDLEALQRAIELLVEEPDLRDSFGRAGRQRMEADFSVPAMVESHIKLYKQLLHE